MECLVLVASVRKALFGGDAERSKFVLAIMQGVRDIIITSQGMNDVDNYNEFCRLLYRFRATAPLNEMAEKPGYLEWIGLVADFTMKAIQSWKVSNGKVLRFRIPSDLFGSFSGPRTRCRTCWVIGLVLCKA